MRYLQVIAFFFFAAAAAGFPGSGGYEARAASKEAANIAPFMALDTLTVAIIHKHKIYGSLIISLQLEVDELQQRSNIAKMKAPLRDAYIMTINRYVSNSFDPRKRLNIELLRGQLQHQTDAVLGEESAPLLIDNVMIRKTH